MELSTGSAVGAPSLELTRNSLVPSSAMSAALPTHPNPPKPSPPQHAGPGGQEGPRVPMAAFSASPLVLKGSCKAGQGQCVREALGSVLGMLRMENNCSEHRQSHPNRAQVCASEIITQLGTALHPRVITKLLQCTGICAGDQRIIVTKRRQGTR